MNLKEQLMYQRYLLKNKHGRVIETPQQMFRRVARTIAKVEARYGVSKAKVSVMAEKFYQLMVSGRFLPNSPTLGFDTK